MKRSELKNIVKELVEAEISKTEIDPETGVKTTLQSIDPETGKLSWDVDYKADPQFVYNKLSQLVDYMKDVDSNSEFGKIKDIIKTLKNKTSRLVRK